MFLIKEVLKNPSYFKTKLKTRAFDISVIDKLVELGEHRSNLIQKIEKLKAKKNLVSSEIAKSKQDNEFKKNSLKNVGKIKNEINEYSNHLSKIVKKINELLYVIPNLPNDKVPIGKNEKQNVVLKEFNKIQKPNFSVIPHHKILVDKKIIDQKRAIKMSGSRFSMFIDKGAQLSRALLTFFLEESSKNGYCELSTPVIVNSKSLIGTGQLPKFKNDLFEIHNYDSWLISTAEITITNYFSNEIIDLSKPKYFSGYTECFRSEAGSAGKDTKGIIRLHQFKKVELVKITTKEQKQNEFNKMILDVRNLLMKLKLPFREVELCTGDLGFSSEYTIDFEVWLPSEKRYIEVSSVSMFSNFQAKRMNLRYKNNDTNEYVYTMNGSGLPIERIVTVLSENWQTKSGEILIPTVLQKYLFFKKI